MANADLLSKTYPELASLDLTPSEEKETDLKNLPVTRNGRMALYLRFVDAAKGDGAIEAAKKAEEALEAKVLEDLQTNANDTDAKAKVAAELDAIKKSVIYSRWNSFSYRLWLFSASFIKLRWIRKIRIQPANCWFF